MNLMYKELRSEQEFYRVVKITEHRWAMEILQRSLEEIQSKAQTIIKKLETILGPR